MIRRVTVCIAGIMNISAYFFFSITPSSFWKSRLKLRMSFLIRIQVIFLMAAPCVQIHLFRSSYFKISPQTDTLTEQDISTVEHAHDEYSCASLCGSTRRCRYAVFDGISKVFSSKNKGQTKQPTRARDWDRISNSGKGRVTISYHAITFKRWIFLWRFQSQLLQKFLRLNLPTSPTPFHIRESLQNTFALETFHFHNLIYFRICIQKYTDIPLTRK